MLTLSILSISLAIARLAPASEIPAWATQGEFFSISRTAEELSIVCQEQFVPEGVKVEKGWKCFKVEGPLDFGLTGILASLTQPLAEAHISIFAISTFDTDYLLVKEANLEKAVYVLKKTCIVKT